MYGRHFPFHKGKLRLINALWGAAVGEDTTRLARLKYGDFKLPCDLREDLQRQFYFFGTYLAEAKNLVRWHKEASGARMVFDVGANLGIYSFAALAAAPHATVHAFEPTPEIAEHLRDAGRLNRLSQLHVHAAAASNRTGFARLRRWRGESGSNGGMNFIVGDAAAGPDRVASVRLDDFSNERGIERIDIMKIDVQGHEAEVLRGAEGLLRDHRVNVIFFELNWAHGLQQPCPARESVGLLEKYGYVFHGAEEANRPRKSGDWMLAWNDIVARSAGEG